MDYDLSQAVRDAVKYRDAEDRKAEAAERDRIMREAIGQWYKVEDTYERPSDATVQLYLGVIRKLHDFCEEAGLSINPPGAGTVAAFLHCLRQQGVNDLRSAAAAISFNATLNEQYDATKHPIVQAVLKDSKGNASKDH